MTEELIASAVTAAMSVEGLVESGEIELLLSLVVKTVPKCIVEVGSYYGRTTVALGLVVKSISPTSKVYAIECGEWRTDTLNRLRQNVSKFGLNDVVEIIPKWSSQVDWSGAIDLLFIDGNHGYPDVVADFGHFERFIAPGGYVAFHDYHKSWPGIVRFITEVVTSGRYSDEGGVSTLKIVRKLG